MALSTATTLSDSRFALLKCDPAMEITIFLMADAVACATRGQKTPDGYYNLERMLKRFSAGAHKLLLCGTCVDARGLTDTDLVDGARRSSMDELAGATVVADKVIVY